MCIASVHIDTVSVSVTALRWICKSKQFSIIVGAVACPLSTVHCPVQLFSLIRRGQSNGRVGYSGRGRFLWEWETINLVFVFTPGWAGWVNLHLCRCLKIFCRQKTKIFPILKPEGQEMAERCTQSVMQCYGSFVVLHSSEQQKTRSGGTSRQDWIHFNKTSAPPPNVRWAL